MNLKAISELKGYTFFIPSLQRGYKWSGRQVNELLNDFDDFITSALGQKFYCLQPLAVVADGNRYKVLDGQQRLTTLYLLYKYLNKEAPYMFVYETDEKRSEYLANIGSDNVNEQDDINWCHIRAAYEAIKDWFGEHPDKEARFKELLDAGKDDRSVQVIWYEVDVGKESDTFRNLNSGKIPLNNTELIKSLFLNRASGLKNIPLQAVAAEFEEMERMMTQDRFRSMLSAEEPRAGQSRMDLLFNLVADVSNTAYEGDAFASFRRFDEARKGGGIDNLWTKLRRTYLRLVDMYNDVELYHYIGFLTYCKKSRNAAERLKEYTTLSKSEFRDNLREEIRRMFPDNAGIDDYTFYTEHNILCRLLLLHNIETILERYRGLHTDKDLSLQHSYERFPFELLYKQSWDIEHIAPQTDSDMKKEQDRKDWLDGVREAYKEQVEAYEAKEPKTPEAFMELYSAIIKQSETGINALDEEGKQKIGNLVLLDSHTNRSFHNSLFPRKRRIVITADGLTSSADKECGARVYIPICTMQCFTKAYSKESGTGLTAWTEGDAKAYARDIEEKLFAKGRILYKV